MTDKLDWPVGSLIPLELRIVQSGVGIPGESPTVELRRFPDDFHWDFAGLDWVASGGTQFQALSDVGEGLYQFLFDQSDDGQPRLFKAIYRNVSISFPGLAEDIHDVRESVHIVPKATASFDSVTDILTINAWIEDDDVVIQAPTDATIDVLDADGDALFSSLVDNTPNNGIFKVTKSSPGLVQNRTFFIKVKITHLGRTFESLRSFITIAAD